MINKIDYTNSAEILEISMTEDIDKYINAVEMVAHNKKDFLFRNVNPLSATIVIAKILEYSKEEAKIYDDCLDGDVADRHKIFADTLSKFFLDGKKLKMIIRNDRECESKIFELLSRFSELYPEQVELRLANNNFRSNLKNVVEKDVNFTVNDNDAFRLESVEHETNIIREAICNFNQPLMATNLNQIFDEQFNSCNKILLPTYA